MRGLNMDWDDIFRGLIQGFIIRGLKKDWGDLFGGLI